MMELAKKELEKEGYDVVGGYFSPSHEDYVSTKPDYNSCLGKRLFQCQKAVENSSWLMIDPWESMYTHTYINFTSVIDRLEKYLQLHVKKRLKLSIFLVVIMLNLTIALKKMALALYKSKCQQ